MPIEPLVLRREDGGGHPGRQVAQRGVATHQVAAMTQHLAIGGDDGDGRRVLDVVEAGGVGEVQPVPEEEAAEGDGAPQHEDGAAIGEAAEERGRSLAGRASRGGAARGFARRGAGAGALVGRGRAQHGGLLRAGFLRGGFLHGLRGRLRGLAGLAAREGRFSTAHAGAFQVVVPAHIVAVAFPVEPCIRIPRIRIGIHAKAHRTQPGHPDDGPVFLFRAASFVRAGFALPG